MASSNSHYNDSEVSKAKESFTNSKVKEEESHDGYEYESDNSNCSVTSNVKGVLPHYEEPVDACADNTIMQQPADSVDTTWTDEKHSSYLNSIEATFVQKMYDKEYCSLDVCGHSSYSSVNLEQECVESHPFCFNNLQLVNSRKSSINKCFLTWTWRWRSDSFQNDRPTANVGMLIPIVKHCMIRCKT